LTGPKIGQKIGLLARLLAPGLFGAELYDTGQLLPLHPEEEQLVAGAAEKSRRDFALGRTSAHAALAELKRDSGPILRADNGAPCWPAGVIGSITHTRGYAAALVARAADFSGLGVDAERTGGVTPDLWPRLFGPDERDYLAQQSDTGRAATILFCAKEACHKAGTERVLRFHDFHVTLADGSFSGRRQDQAFRGRFAMAGDLVLTVAWRAEA
jgi:4'-phosphopantetheinyl transferase EntD